MGDFCIHHGMTHCPHHAVENSTLVRQLIDRYAGLGEIREVVESDLMRVIDWARADEREACAKLADVEKNACESHLRACKLVRRKGVQHQAGAQIARDIARYIRSRSTPKRSGT